MIGATGGSGTRVVAKILRSGGMFTGEKLNPYEDAVELGFYSDRWIDRYVETGGDPSGGIRREMAADLASVLADHLSALPDDAVAWGWKEPRSIYLLPFWNETMPSVRFLHFLRDGRDMAFSENQNQLKKHGRAVLGDDLRKAKTPVRSIALWDRVNAAAADFGEREARLPLPPRALRGSLCRAGRDRRPDLRLLRARGRRRGHRASRGASARHAGPMATPPEGRGRRAQPDRRVDAPQVRVPLSSDRRQ